MTVRDRSAASVRIVGWVQQVVATRHSHDEKEWCDEAASSDKPVGTLIAAAVALTGAAAVTAVTAGRRATSRGAVQSVGKDW